MADTNRLIALEIDDSDLPAPSPQEEQDRRVAVFDLLEENVYGFSDDRAPEGPYRLHLSVQDGRLVFDTETEAGDKITAFHLSLSPFRQVIKDYFQIRDAYFDAVKRLPAAQIEAIDMGRRGIHDEGARVLIDRLEGKLVTDKATARRLFTLICALQSRG